MELLTSGELLVVDETGREVPHDGQSLGEIVVRGNVVMKGYYADPEATAAAIRDGWFHSGDAAVVHPDGYVEVRDRLKDVIISCVADLPRTATGKIQKYVLRGGRSAVATQ